MHLVTALLLAKAREGRRASLLRSHNPDAPTKNAETPDHPRVIVTPDDVNHAQPGQPGSRSTQECHA